MCNICADVCHILNYHIIHGLMFAGKSDFTGVPITLFFLANFEFVALSFNLSINSLKTCDLHSGCLRFMDPSSTASSSDIIDAVTSAQRCSSSNVH